MADCVAACCVIRLVSFDPLRTLDIPGVSTMKPDEMFRRRDEVAAADWVLFPEEWQLNALAYALHARIFPSMPSYRFGQDKVQFTRALWALCPKHAPTTLILPATEESVTRVVDELDFPLVVKRPRSSMGVGVYKVNERRDLLNLLPRLEVLYAQEYLDIDRDLRVVWVGDEVVSAYWRTGGDGFRHNIACGGEADFDDVPPLALELVAQVANGLGIDHGGFDLAQVGGHWYLLELNLRFGNTALRCVGVSLAPLILRYLERCTDPRGNPGRPPFGIAA